MQYKSRAAALYDTGRFIMIPTTIPPDMIYCTEAKFDEWWSKNVLGLPDRMPTSFWCYYCRKTKPESQLKIYDVRNDKYFCSETEKRKYYEAENTL